MRSAPKRSGIAMFAVCCGTTAAFAQLGEPTPRMTTDSGLPLVDPFTLLASDFLPPGTGPAMNGTGWPGSTVTAANFNMISFETTAEGLGDPVLGGTGFNLLNIESGPIRFTASGHSGGTIDLNFGLGDPSNPLSDPDNPFYLAWPPIADLALELNDWILYDWDGFFGSFRNTNGNFMLRTGGQPTYAWMPHVAQGVLMVQASHNGITRPGQDVETVYGIANITANGARRGGPGFTMVEGHWGWGQRNNSTGDANWIGNSGFGDMGRVSTPVSVAWFPYEQGWIGGYHHIKGYELNRTPVFWADTSSPTGAVTDPADIEEIFVFPESQQIGPITVDWKVDEVTGISQIFGLGTNNFADILGFTNVNFTDHYAMTVEGTITVGNGTYFLGFDVDDSAELEIKIDGQWINVANRRVTGGCSLFEGEVNLAAGTYEVRASMYQRGGGACFSLYLDSLLTFGEPMTFDAPGATVKIYDLFQMNSRNGSRYVGLVDANGNGQPDYGLGTWRMEGIVRHAAHRSLIGHDDAVKYMVAPAGFGDANGIYAHLRYDIPNATPQRGMLFAQATETNNRPTWGGLLPPAPGDAHWKAHFRRNTNQQVDTSGPTVQRTAGAASIASTGTIPNSFVYIPYNAVNLIGGYIKADGTADRLVGNASVVRTEPGRFEVSIPGKNGSDGMILLMPVGVSELDSDFATRALFSYEYDAANEVFVVEGRDWIPGDDGQGNFDRANSAFPLVDSGFYFVWVDFENPLTMPQGCNAADLAEPFGVLNFFDLAAYLNLFNAGDPAADLNNDGVLNFFDVSTYLSIFNAGCPE
ncbi:MAG: hypothetical protein LAT64_09025 [Phycisphaerales bacterium]|nr:hypothetical protein [Planctomycetota bacterium]MCH8508892.1 hypothetical protein [Phycisphaerales bacterium]